MTILSEISLYFIGIRQQQDNAEKVVNFSVNPFNRMSFGMNKWVRFVADIFFIPFLISLEQIYKVKEMSNIC